MEKLDTLGGKGGRNDDGTRDSKQNPSIPATSWSLFMPWLICPLWKQKSHFTACSCFQILYWNSSYVLSLPISSLQSLFYILKRKKKTIPKHGGRCV